MEEKEMLSKIQALADEVAQNFVFKKTAKLELVYTEKLANGSTDCYCIGSDMPLLVYRVFNVKEDGTVAEYNDIKISVEKTKHYNTEVKPALGLEKAPLITGETGEYEILLENKLENNAGVEIKLRSSVERDLTMVEIYRYFDYVSKVYFVSCVAVSFGGQYLFSVTQDSKHLRLIVGNNPELKKRVDMMTELLQARLLPSYQTIADGAKLLAGQVKANVTLNGQNGEKNEFESTFCYDDPETQTRFCFFAKVGNPQDGIILVQDVFTQKLSMSNTWTDAQKAAVDKFKALMKEKPEEFNKHATSFFSDDLDFRYNAFKNGTLKAGETEAKKEEPKAE